MKSFRSATLVVLSCFWAASLSNCSIDLTTDTDRFTYNLIKIRNETNDQIFVEVKSTSQVIDTTALAPEIISQVNDTTFQLNSFQHGPLFRIEMPSSNRRQMGLDSLIENIIQLVVYKIADSDTTYAHVILRDQANWTRHTEEVYYSFHWVHHHNLLILDRQFE